MNKSIQIIFNIFELSSEQLNKPKEKMRTSLFLNMKHVR